MIQSDGLRIGTLAAVYGEPGGRSWALVRERRFGGRRRVVPLDDARSTETGIVVPYSRDVVRGAPVIAPGAPDPREAERLSVYYTDVAADAAPADAAPATPVPKTSPAAPAELAEALAEARYCEERLSLYRARRYGGNAVSDQRMRELERARDSAQARLRRMQAPAERQPDDQPEG